MPRALFAALLAIDAFPERTSRNPDQQKLEQAEAKISAVVHVTPLVHAAAECLFSINKAINVLPDADKLVELATSHLNAEMSRFVVPESLRGLGMDDRLECLTIVGALNVFLTVSDRQSPTRTRVRRLEAQRDALMKLHFYLRTFDPDLAHMFARDSETSPADALEPPVAEPGRWR